MFVKAAYWYNTADIYYFALLIAAFVFLLVNGILRSRPGLELMAMRDNDEAAAASGINLFAAKLFAFIVSGFMTGVIGGLFYLQQVSLQPKSAFSMAWTVAAVFIVVIGGLGTVAGPIVGAILYVILVQLLSNFAGISMILLGAIAIAVMLFMPKGIVGTLQNRYGFELFSPRRIVE
jgi:branched-chain amino acid transport system permease protein